MQLYQSNHKDLHFSQKLLSNILPQNTYLPFMKLINKIKPLNLVMIHEQCNIIHKLICLLNLQFAQNNSKTTQNQSQFAFLFPVRY